MRFILALIAIFFSPLTFAQEVSIKNLHGKEIATNAKEIATFANTSNRQVACYFSEAEWDGYIQSYVNTPVAIISVAFSNDKIVGVAIGTALKKASQKYQMAFSDRVQELNSLYLLEELVILPEYRKDGVCEKLYQEFERSVAEKKQFSGICTWNTKAQDGSWEIPFFQKLGYKCFPEIHFDELYKESSSTKEAAHSFVCWKKQLS